MKGLLIDLKSNILFWWLFFRFFRDIKNKYIICFESVKIIHYFCKMRFEDRICRLYNNLIPYIIPDYPKRSSNLIKIEATAGYGTLHMHYIFNSISSKGVGGQLYNQILFTFDKFLNWCDLTEFGDSRVIIHIHNVSANKIERLSYFELMGVCYSSFRTSYLSEHPRLDKFLLWKENLRNIRYESETMRLIQKFEQDNLERIMRNQELLISL